MIRTYFLTVQPETAPRDGTVEGSIVLVYLDEDIAEADAVAGLLLGCIDVAEGAAHPRPGDRVTVDSDGYARRQP